MREYEVTFGPTVSIGVKSESLFWDSSITNPCSLLELSVQVRLMEEYEVVDAMSPLGATGG